MASEWQAETGPIFLVRQLFETTEEHPLRKVEHYVSKEVGADEVENTAMLDDWHTLKIEKPQQMENISKLNHYNWEKEKASKGRLEEQEKHEEQGRCLSQFLRLLCMRSKE